jgi:hypothetical protein
MIKCVDLHAWCFGNKKKEMDRGVIGAPIGGVEEDRFLLKGLARLQDMNVNVHKQFSKMLLKLLWSSGE